MPRPLPTDAEARAILASKRPRPLRRPAPPAGKSLAPLIKALDARFGQGTGALENRWPEIVGEQLARVTEPVKLSKGRPGQGGALELRVVGPAAAFVQHQAPEIISRVNLFLGEGAVERLRISQGPIKPRAARAQPQKRPVDRPLDAARDEALSASVDPAASDGLRQALLNLGRRALKTGDGSGPAR
ncbi:MAG: DUF721 domain-containing protein [Caulobacterales bacterium]|nr:DUF721 domain-containing protein [Caulobacterales bacterium]